jgi:hypothetical protein
VLLKPLDTGRFTLLPQFGVIPLHRRLEDASRARVPSFNSAIVGNSQTQLLSPEHLSGKTAGSFVSLAMPGTGPKEQMAVLEHSVRSRAHSTRVIILGADLGRYTAVRNLPASNPFPFRLYDESSLKYAVGLLRLDAVIFARQRILTILGRSERLGRMGIWTTHQIQLWRRQTSLISRDAFLNRSASRRPSGARLSVSTC